jgi:very-short-patch-repair endonuclease
MRAPEPVDVLRSLDGSAPSRELVGLCGRRGVERALRNGQIERPRRGYYALPALEPAVLCAHRLGGVISHESAAVLWGIDVIAKPTRHHVTVGRQRASSTSVLVVTHWADLVPADVRGRITSPLRTVLDCARTLSFSAALVVADSALRTGQVTAQELTSAAAASRGAGSRRVRCVVGAADHRAGSALESLLRGLLIESDVTNFVPQLVIRDAEFFARVDLADPVTRLVLEADSFSHHGHRDALSRDCRRYDELVIRGWTVLRFAWEHVMFDQAWVVATVRAALIGAVASRTAAWAQVGRSA